MTLWLIFAAITASVLALLLSPLRRKQNAMPQRLDYDIAVYRDQLAEIEKDVERDFLSADQADAARAEIYRRMLAADDIKSPSPWGGARGGVQKRPFYTPHLTSPQGGRNLPHLPQDSFGSKLALTLIIIIGLPLGAGLMYARLGNPQLPGRPYAQRQHDPDFILTNEAEQLEAYLETRPDAEDYKRLADIWFVMHRYDKAAAAYRKLTDMSGDDANIWASLGESVAFSQEGSVTPEAREAFIKALKLDPKNPRARFYLGLSEAQRSQPRRAVAVWRDLEKDSPPDAPWLTLLKKQITAVSKTGGFDPQSIPPAPPSPSDADAVMAMSPFDQNAAIHKMVDRLAAKMESNPGDLDGWLRLAKAYRVLGETEKAEMAESKAAALRGNAPNGAATAQ